jgi:hypothetical protein
MGVAIVICLLAYLALPDMAGYLIPLVPAVLIVAARFAPRVGFQALCLCLLIAPWVELRGGKIVAGAILADRGERIATMRDVQKFVNLTEEKLPGQNTIVVGAWEPLIVELFAGQSTHNRYVYLLTPDELHVLVQNRSPIAYSSETMRGFNYSVHGVDLAAFGARNVRQLLIGHP